MSKFLIAQIMFKQTKIERAEVLTVIRLYKDDLILCSYIKLNVNIS